MIGRTSRRVYGSDHDDPDPGPRPGHTYAELTGGPLDGLLLDITGRDPGTALEVLLLRRVPRTGLCLLPASHGRPPARPAAADPAHMAVRALPDPGRPHRSGA
ncbi:hypothetical protein ACIRQY_34880 [Streptomyces sp. NPDC101490]|uniref:hypothetical protein n=1 Tax=Streptomyces sp. NPDC101490 TaxID=3366143 RepID=UPI003820FB2D